MRLDKLSKITCVFVLALWAGPSAALAEADCATWNTRQFFAVATPADMARCLEAGANLEARDDEYGWTPLHRAAAHGSPDLVQALVQAGADLEARSKDGLTPLHRAAAFGSPDLVQALLDAGANPGARSKAGRLPFDLIGEDSRLTGTDAYWRLHDARWK